MLPSEEEFHLDQVQEEPTDKQVDNSLPADAVREDPTSETESSAEADEPDAGKPTVEFEGVLPRQDRRQLTEETTLWQAGTANFLGAASIGTFINAAGNFGDHLYRRDDRGEVDWEIGVDDVELERLVSVFVKPAPYDRAYVSLSNNRLIILRGLAGCGKSAAATFMAWEIHKHGQVAIRRLSADTDLRRWSRSDRLGRDTIYLIDGLLGTRSKEMPDHVWRELSDTLKSKNSYLVICSSQYVTFAAEAQFYIHPWEPPEDGEIVLRKHLRFNNMDEGDLTALISSSQIQGLLAKRPALQIIYLISCRLTEFDNGVFTSLEEALQGLSISDEAAVAEWFRGAVDDEERALWLALAVFNGSRFRLAQDASKLLVAQIRKTFGPPADVDKQSTQTNTWFEALGDDWRARANVELRLEDYYGHNLLPVEVARLRDPSLPQGVFRYLWGRLPRFRPVLLDWLAQLGMSEQSESRIRAATAVAFLAQLDFETVLRLVLESWVKETTRETRQSLAYALGSLALSEQYAEATFILLRNWASSREIPRVWAAARAYGIIGPYYPHEAMDGWLGILSRYDYLEHYRVSPTLHLSIVDPLLRPLFDSLFEAVASFFITALAQPRTEFIRIYAQIVTALRVWLEENDDDGLFTLTSLVLFLGLMNLRIGEDSLVEADAVAEGPDEVQTFRPQGAPALLVLVHNLASDNTALDDLGWLLSLAIRTRETRKATIHGALHDWLIYLQETNDEQLYVALKRVIRTLVRQPSFAVRRWRREIGLPFEQWSVRKPPKPKEKQPSKNKEPRRETASPPLPMAGRLVHDVVELQR